MSYSLPAFPFTSKVRKEFLSASEFAEIPLDFSVKNRILDLENVSNLETERFRGLVQIWKYALLSCIGSIKKATLWSVIAAITTLVAVLCNQKIIASIENFQICLYFAAAFLLAELITNYARFIEMLQRAQGAVACEASLVRLINAKLAVLDHSRSPNITKGNLKTLVNSDVDNVVEFYFAAASNWLPSLTLLLILTPALYTLIGFAGLIAIVVALLQVPFSMLCGFYIERFQVKRQSVLDSMTSRLSEWLKNMRLIRYLRWQKALEREISKGMDNYNLRSVPGYTIECFVYSLSGGWWMMPLISILIYSHYADLNLSLAEVFASLWALNYLSAYIQHLPYSLTRYGSAAAAIKRINVLLQAPELSRGFVKDPSAELPAANEKACSLELHDVSVTFGARRILQIPKLILDLNKRTAIVGEVGSGKSTLLKILSAECVPDTGKVLIKGSSNKVYDLWNKDVQKWWKSKLIVSHQEAFLSNSSVTNNITLHSQADESLVKQAVNKAELVQDIESFTHGYAEEVGETGINLSGGQKARVNLARGFYSARPLMLLDDPLSAVDIATEKKLVQQIFQSSQGLVLVSHRFGELQHCHRIIVLEDGKVVEDGVPSELAASGETKYSRFLKAHPEGENLTGEK